MRAGRAEDFGSTSGGSGSTRTGSVDTKALFTADGADWEIPGARGRVSDF